MRISRNTRQVCALWILSQWIGLNMSLSLYNSYCRNLLWFFYYQVSYSLSGFIYGSNGDDVQQPCMMCEKMYDSSSHAILLNYDYFSCHLWGWFCFHLPSKPDFLAFIWSKLLFLKFIPSIFFFLISLELRVSVIFCLFVCLQPVNLTDTPHRLHIGRTLNITSIVRSLWTHTRRACPSWSVGRE